MKKILWILGQYNSRHVIKHVTLKFIFKISKKSLLKYYTYEPYFVVNFGNVQGLKTGMA